MAHKKSAGKLRQQKRTSGKRLGVKVSDGEPVTNGMILVRQRGTKWKVGTGVKLGRDFTIYAVSDGKVKFGKSEGRTTVSVV